MTHIPQALNLRILHSGTDESLFTFSTEGGPDYGTIVITVTRQSGQAAQFKTSMKLFRRIVSLLSAG